MKVYVLYECSGRVRDAFRARGHDAWSVDLLPCDGNDTYHIQADVTKLFQIGAFDDADMILAYPPCQYLCNSGVRWLYESDGLTLNEDRWYLMRKGAQVFNQVLDHPCPKKCIENSIPHKYAVKLIGRKYDQIIQPWMFGEDASKATCLWLEGLYKLKPTNIIKKKRYANQTPSGQNKLGPSPERAKLRGITYQEIANAKAEQWG